MLKRLVSFVGVVSVAVGLLPLGGSVAVAVAAAGVGVGAAAGRSVAVGLCGVVDAGRVVAPVSGLPSVAVSSVVGSVDPSVVWQAGRLYVGDWPRGRVLVYDGARSLVATVPVGAFSMFTVDPSGSVYVLRSPSELVKLSAVGVVVWRKTLGSPVRSLFGRSLPGGWRVAVGTSAGTSLFDAAGVAQGSVEVAGSSFTEAADGSLVTTDGRYVRVYDAGWKLVQVFGDKGFENDPMPTGAPRHFYQQGAAVRLPDGRFLVADGGRGVELVEADGTYVGFVAQDVFGGFTQSPGMVLDDAGGLFLTSGPKFVTGAQSVKYVSVASVVAAASAPSAESPRLGYGAGLWVEGAAGKYYRAGVKPSVRASFDPWWKSVGGLVLEYRVRDRAQVRADAAVGYTRVPVSTAVVDSGTGLELPAATPGYFEVEAFLSRDGVRRSGTCVSYTVGAAGQELDLVALPGSADAGGPDPARGVALADILGTGAYREGLKWDDLMPGGAGSTGPLSFSRYDGEIAAGAAEAAKRGVPFVVQLGDGGIERQLVDNGTWEARVREVVAHYKGVVSYWEAWNEPNITFGSSESYVAKVLKPVYRAVKSVDPNSKVLGSSAVGTNLQEWWYLVGAAGGFAAMDIVGIHPYTGHNRSFEEEGTGEFIAALKSILAANGSAGKPIWVTEHAWWSNGQVNLFSQADFSARAQLLYREWGVARWSYFLAQGTWGNDGVTFSAIEGEDHVKPVALALMTQKTQVGSRPLSGPVQTGVPHVFAQRYGATAAAPGEVLAVWSDDVALDMALTNTSAAALSVPVVDVLGATRTLTVPAHGALTLPVDGSPQYLTVPAGGALALTAAQAWGANLAVSATGASATASTGGSWNPAYHANDGITAARGQGDFRSSPAWASAVGDSDPTLTVTLAKAQPVNRVLLSTLGLNSTLTGIRALPSRPAPPTAPGPTPPP
jgi:hypothetical protein